MKKLFFTAVAMLAFSNFSAVADEKKIVFYTSCEDQAFDAVATYFDNSSEDNGFTAGAIFEFVYNRCMNE